jgi:ADP-ribosyl-[dinitrogen reductase] hydrolase
MTKVGMARCCQILAGEGICAISNKEQAHTLRKESNVQQGGKAMDIAKESIASDLADRCRGAIWGQFIGDAACLGAHLIKDANEMKRLFPLGVSGFEAPPQERNQAGKKSGDLTHYGDAALLMLQSVAELGYFSAVDFGPRLVAFFSNEEYQGAVDKATKGMLEKYEAFTKKRPGASYHYQGGADNDDAVSTTRIAPVVVNRLQQASLLKVVQNAVTVCQNNERAILYAKCHALIMKEVLAGHELRQAVKSAAHAMTGEGKIGKEIAILTETVLGMLGMDVREATRELGQSSSVKEVLPAAMQCALKYEGNFRRAIVETANAGGDNAARAAIIGAWLGARHGMKGIPEQWLNQLNEKDLIERYIEKIVSKVGKNGK